MAPAIDGSRKAVLEAQQQIFNKLCIAHRRSRESLGFRVLAEDVRSELKIENSIFARALDSFVDASGERIVLMFEQNGKQFIGLGESAKLNLSDWMDISRATAGNRSAIGSESMRRVNYGPR